MLIVCRELTDLAVFEVASLAHLRKLRLVRVPKLTDIAIFALAEHAKALESLNISYCDRLSLDAVHLLLKKVETLQHLETTGVPSFRRKGIKRFSDTAPNVSRSRGAKIHLMTSFPRFRISMCSSKQPIVYLEVRISQGFEAFWIRKGGDDRLQNLRM
jgi:hypothetical protein